MPMHASANCGTVDLAQPVQFAVGAAAAVSATAARPQPPAGVIAQRLNELLDSIRCRAVLARLRTAGYSDHVAQRACLEVRAGMWGWCCLWRTQHAAPARQRTLGGSYRHHGVCATPPHTRAPAPTHTRCSPRHYKTSGAPGQAGGQLRLCAQVDQAATTCSRLTSKRVLGKCKGVSPAEGGRERRGCECEFSAAARRPAASQQRRANRPTAQLPCRPLQPLELLRYLSEIVVSLVERLPKPDAAQLQRQLAATARCGPRARRPHSHRWAGRTLAAEPGG